ncbi:MAG TPA: helix-turn-helix-type transcriptional regulator [Bacteroidales bacterium]|nr:helix-turn-helix-type transcriptional regulator [Bacteroidales bacterium]
MSRYTIAELEKLTGIRAGTIRIWERRYRIIKPHRTDTNRRWYDDEELVRIINIAILYRHDVKISKIATMTGEEIAAHVALLTKDTGDAGTQLDTMVVAMTALNEKSINEILVRSIITRGFEDTFENIVFPFLRRVGVMWQTGSFDIGSEHFISNIFRKRLIVATDSLPQSEYPGRKRVLLFLPEMEMHELGLLYFGFVIKKAGHETLYLGQTTPFNALKDAADRWNPDIMVTGSLTGLPFERPEDYLNRLSSAFTTKKILVSGAMAEVAARKKFANIFAVASIADLKIHL